MEEMLRGAAPRPSALPVRLHAGVMRPEALWRRIILRALVSGHMDIAEKYQAMFEKTYPDQAFLTDIYIRKKKSLSISREEISRLRAMPDSPEVLRAKIYFREELQLTDQDCANIAALLPVPKDEVEKYYWAKHLYEVYQADKKSGKSDKLPFAAVINAFRDAVLAGSKDAADLFAQFCGGERRADEAREIADMGNPTGAYIYRLLAITLGKPDLESRYLKMAAALGHPKAVTIVAEECWKKRVFGRTISFDSEKGRILGIDEKTIHSGIAIYEHLKNSFNSIELPDIYERLGFFYFCSKQWQKSRDVIGDYPNTTEGNFCLAVMYKYGYGGTMSRESSIRFIRKAENMEGFFALLSASVKEAWRDEELSKLKSKLNK